MKAAVLADQQECERKLRVANHQSICGCNLQLEIHRDKVCNHGNKHRVTVSAHPTDQWLLLIAAIILHAAYLHGSSMHLSLPSFWHDGNPLCYHDQIIYKTRADRRTVRANRRFELGEHKADISVKSRAI